MSKNVIQMFFRIIELSKNYIKFRKSRHKKKQHQTGFVFLQALVNGKNSYLKKILNVSKSYLFLSFLFVLYLLMDNRIPRFAK